MKQEPFDTVLLGCGGMGSRQAKIIHSHPAFRLVAVCDINPQQSKKLAAEMSVKGYTDPVAMFTEHRPVAAAICTINTAHAPLSIEAIKHGVKGILCEKPMATHLADAQAMTEAARTNGCTLAINHQRRMGADMVAARQLIADGAIGDLRVLRGYCAGDMLSDGTHVFDSLMFLAGDPDVLWVTGQTVRDLPSMEEKLRKRGLEIPPEGVGQRYGHPVESGAVAVVQLANGLRVEVFTGDMMPKEYIYQDYVIEGTKGTLWRLGDRSKPENLFLFTADPGTHDLVSDHTTFRLVPAPGGVGRWRKIEYEPDTEHLIIRSYDQLAEGIRTGAPHPLRAEIALRGFQGVIGTYESARRGERLYIPFENDRFPLEAMLESR